MTIRARLTIAIAIVLLVTVATLGAVAVQTTRATLTDQVDAQVEQYAKKTRDKPIKDDPGGGSYGDEYPPPDDAQNNDEYSGDAFARVVYNPDGSIHETQRFGWGDDRLPPPSCPDVNSGEFDDSLNEVVTLSSQDGSVEYRTLIEWIDGGRYYQAVSIPLNDVNDAVDSMKQMVFFATGASFIAAIGICWWVIRRGLKPVDHMVATAADIAGGNLGARIDTTSPHTELGRLGDALNEMMGKIQASNDARDKGEQKLRQFVADAAHELRTPLTSLRGYAELYRQGALHGEGAVDNAMGRIESEGARMARLVDDLLLLARLDQDRSIDRVPVDLADVATDAVADFRVVAPDRETTTDIADHTTVLGDRMRLRQIVDNLLANVRTHTPAGTAVHVSVTHAGNTATLTVKDSGPGIAPEDQHRIFERFWRTDKARTRSRGGTGLGLAIVASLVEAHSGAVSIESTPGQGASFSVSFPLAPPA